jgi:hypothetical protein
MLCMMVGLAFSGSVRATDVCNCLGYAGIGGPCYSGIGGQHMRALVAQPMLVLVVLVLPKLVPLNMESLAGLLTRV